MNYLDTYVREIAGLKRKIEVLAAKLADSLCLPCSLKRWLP